MADGNLFGISDLHVEFPANRQIVENIWPESDADWLLVGGDVGERAGDIEWVLGLLSERFATVVWVPGNHDLWTLPDDPVQLRGEQRYKYLVEACRRVGVVTPEDPYLVWQGQGGPVTIAPLFLLYDYSLGKNIGATKAESLAKAYDVGVVCSDEFLLHTDPYPSMDAWCHVRVEETKLRLAARDADVPTVLVNHFPLNPKPTRLLRYPEFAQWCGTEQTADWHRRFQATAVVYGHLHIPRTTWHDGVRFEEVSLRRPLGWDRRGLSQSVLRRVLPK